MLFRPTHTVCTDEAGDKAVLADLAPPYIPGPYSYPDTLGHVPSLVSLCLRALAEFPDQVHQLPVQLSLRPRLIDDLIPDPATVDPRLWATIVQVYDALPPFFASCVAPLADIHLPLLQTIPSTPSFSLVTVLDLPACTHLTDDNILLLRFLNTLAAFDASQTTLTAYAVRSLAATLQVDSDSAHRGPWPLRILSLRNCKRISNDVYAHLVKFPLLSVIDLRGTGCTLNPSSPFQSCDDDDLFYPTCTRDALAALETINFYSSPNTYTLHINTLHHLPTHTTPRKTVAAQDAFVVIPSSSGAQIKVGNSRVLQHQIRTREETIAHERNKEAWYERQDRMDNDMPTKGRSSWGGPQPYPVPIALPKKMAQPSTSRNQDRESRTTHRTLTGIERSSWIGAPRPRNQNGSASRLVNPNSRRAHSPLARTTLSELRTARPTPQNADTHASRPHIHPPRTDANPDVAAHATPRSRPANTAEQAHLSRPRTILDAESPPPPLRHASSDPELFYRNRVQQQRSRDLEGTRRLDAASRVERRVAYESTRSDSRLRLFRLPPPWSALSQALHNVHRQQEEARKNREFHQLAKKEEAATVDLTSRKAEMARKGLKGAVENRTAGRVPQAGVYGTEDCPTSTLVTVLNPIQPHPHPKPKSRNPFRKPPPSAIENDPRMNGKDTAHMRGQPPIPPPLRDVKQTSTTKMLKPISAVKIPVLPAELREEQVPASESTLSSSTSASRKRIKTDVAGIKSRHSSSTSSAQSKVAHKKPFDWKSWGKS